MLLSLRYCIQAVVFSPPSCTQVLYQKYRPPCIIGPTLEVFYIIYIYNASAKDVIQHKQFDWSSFTVFYLGYGLAVLFFFLFSIANASIVLYGLNCMLRMLAMSFLTSGETSTWAEVLVNSGKWRSLHLPSLSLGHPQLCEKHCGTELSYVIAVENGRK